MNKQIKKINSYTKIICDRFRKIGYNVPTVVCKVRDNYIKQNGDFYPLFTDENGKTIYIDIINIFWREQLIEGCISQMNLALYNT